MTASTEQLRAASQRLMTTVDALAEDDWAAPSLLPGWTRAHVLAHLALNGEAFAGAIGGVLRGERVPMYVSDQSRDEDIDTLATVPPVVSPSTPLFAVTRMAPEVTIVVPEYVLPEPRVTSPLFWLATEPVPLMAFGKV